MKVLDLQFSNPKSSYFRKLLGSFGPQALLSTGLRKLIKDKIYYLQWENLLDQQCYAKQQPQPVALILIQREAKIPKDIDCKQRIRTNELFLSRGEPSYMD